MIVRYVLSVMLLACGLFGHAQADTRPVVGVAPFNCDMESPFTGLVTEKVVEMLTNTHRFQVVDRTSRDKIVDELELQKSEAFLYSKNLVDQNSSLSAEYIITGHIVKIPVYAIKNTNGSVRGYKASVAFQMKVEDVKTSTISEATSFEGKASKECVSPESAVTMAMFSLQEQVYEYFRITFPLRASLVRVLDEKKILIGAGKEQGIREGDKFVVEAIEFIGGKPYPATMGTAKVKKLAEDSFSECEVSKKIGKTIGEKLSANADIRCSLVIKK